MRRSDSLNTFSCLSLYGLLTRFCTGALRVSQVLKRFSPYMPRPSTPAESPASCLYRCSLIGFQSIYTVALRFDNVTRLYSFRDGATPLTACMIPCVRLHCVVRFFFPRLLSAPPQCQHSVRVVGYSLPGRDFHPARNAKLSLAHRPAFHKVHEVYEVHKVHEVHLAYHACILPYVPASKADGP